ncbi:MAG: hypothetical protein A6D91_09190 [Bacillaceae bacterium G1]|nr:hypothetical protein [Bacillota bacterium]OJF16693.1 MAG: hypothetical protein A6D91_09190 [Bacillaceae bacterium G1]
MTKKKQFPLRIDQRVYEALERWAADEFRSVNAQIEYLLRDALRRAKRWKDDIDDNDQDGKNDKE